MSNTKKQENKKQKKIFVLDTNVLLHNPNSIHSFREDTVVIPIKVLEELDKFKKDRTEVGKNAREAARILDQYRKKGKLDEGVSNKYGGELIVSFNITKHFPVVLDKRVPDDIIISCALYFKDIEPDADIFFVSKDINARIKADALGLKAIDYEKQKTEYEKIYKGYSNITVNSSKIDELYKNKEIEIQGEYFPNHCFLLIDEKNEKHTALGKYDFKNKKIKLISNKINCMGIYPLNLEQVFSFNLLLDENIKLVNLIGMAGTGKTLIALAAALKLVLEEQKYERLLVARPVIPMGKDIGYLPGSKDEKLAYWMQPIFDNLELIFSKIESKDKKKPREMIKSLVAQNLLEIEALTYIRGRSIPNQFLIIDEAQNLTPLEVKTIISRAGENTKIVLTGDPNQIDNPYLDENSNGLSYVVDRLKFSEIVGSILLGKSERSALAALAAEKL